MSSWDIPFGIIIFLQKYNLNSKRRTVSKRLVFKFITQFVATYGLNS